MLLSEAYGRAERKIAEEYVRLSRKLGSSKEAMRRVRLRYRDVSEWQVYEFKRRHLGKSK